MTILEQIIQERDNWNITMRMHPGVNGGPQVLHEFVLRNGQYYQGQDLPSNYKYRPLKQCFFNASSMAVDRRYRKHPLRYCEGFARARDFSFLFHHGWTINEYGEVIDATLRQGHNYEYYGVWFHRGDVVASPYASLLCSDTHYDTEFMCRFDTGFEAVLEAWKNRAPIDLKDLIDVPAPFVST
jgi:hypothetical protein